MKIKIFVMCALSALFLTGCQLAKPEKESSSTDRLAGVFITSEYLDLFDMEGYLNEHLNSFDSREIKLEGGQTKYEGRLYASFAGEDNRQVTFGDVEGIPFFTAEKLNENKEVSIYSYNGDGLICGRFGSFYSDDEDKTTLDGTIYIVPNVGEQVHYINPVYQSADGSVYAKAGNGMSMSSVQSQGNVMSHKVEETLTVTQNGKSKQITTLINLSIETMFAPQKINVVQMDTSNNILSISEYVAGKLPQSIDVDKAAAYVIFETYKIDFDGKEIVERQLYSADQTSVTTFFNNNTNIIASQYTELVWQS